MATQTSRWTRLRREHPYLSLGLAILAVESLGILGSVFTVQGLDGWYDTLARPEFAPPNWVFGPVWTALFALLGVAVWLVWQAAGVDDRATGGQCRPGRPILALGVFWAHAVVNVAWSAAFFGLQSPLLGLVVIAVLWVAIVLTLWLFWRVDRRAGLLLVPYLLWVSFAAYLNYGIWQLS
ncbi:TspO/MBR family protein [Halobacteriales archaeon Cl-PHB]